MRDLALVRLLISCGLRVGEAVNLQVDDLEIGDRYGIVVIRSGKGNKYCEVPVPPEARKALREWLAEREKNWQSKWLFPNRNGGHISTRHVKGIIKNYARFAGLDVHPHVLRHTCATNLIRSGYDLSGDRCRHSWARQRFHHGHLHKALSSRQGQGAGVF